MVTKLEYQSMIEYSQRAKEKELAEMMTKEKKIKTSRLVENEDPGVNVRDTKKKKEKVTKFIEILFSIFESADPQGVFSWSQDGTGILISNQVEFSEKILSQHFKHSNFASFIRQLNLYGFKKVKSDICDHHYYHSMFRRGHRELLGRVKRKKLAMKEQKETPKKQEESDVTSISESEKLWQENLGLRKNHKELTDKIILLNQKFEKLTAENDTLADRQQIERLKVMVLSTCHSQSTPNLSAFLGHEMQQLTPGFTFAGAPQQNSNRIHAFQPQADLKAHFQIGQMPEPTLSHHHPQQLYGTVSRFPREPSLLENPPMRFGQSLQSPDLAAFGNSKMKIGSQAAISTDLLMNEQLISERNPTQRLANIEAKINEKQYVDSPIFKFYKS